MYPNAEFMRRISGQTAGRCHDDGNDLPKAGFHSKYLVNVFSYMIDESHTAQNTPWLGASDEACITYIDRGYCFMNNGSWSADNPPYVAFGELIIKVSVKLTSSCKM